jgi:phosphate transport system protein
MEEENLNIDHHISQNYNRELESLRAKVLSMGGIVERQCRNAVEALVQGDAELAEQVATSDHEVNALEVEINAECVEILARRQPAASDLRMVIAVIRLISDLERIGDEAEKIGRLARQLSASHSKQSFYTEPNNLGSSVVTMLQGALDAFARLDVKAAVSVAAQDPDIDREFESLTRLLLTHIMEDPQRVKEMLKVNWCARALERIGDHAVNICEEVIFLVKGSDVRHLSLEEIQRRYA